MNNVAKDTLICSSLKLLINKLLWVCSLFSFLDGKLTSHHLIAHLFKPILFVIYLLFLWLILERDREKGMLTGGKSMLDPLIPRITGVYYHFCQNQYIKENHEVSSNSWIEQILNNRIYKFIGKGNTMREIIRIIVQTAYQK